MNNATCNLNATRHLGLAMLLGARRQDAVLLYRVAQVLAAAEQRRIERAA